MNFNKFEEFLKKKLKYKRKTNKNCSKPKNEEKKKPIESFQ